LEGLDFDEKLYLCQKKNLISDAFVLSYLSKKFQNTDDQKGAEMNVRILHSLLFSLNSQVNINSLFKKKLKKRNIFFNMKSL